MDYGIVNELQRLRPGESLSHDDGILVSHLDFTMVVFMFNPTIDKINVIRKLGQGEYTRGTASGSYQYDVYLLYRYDSTEILGYALRFFGNAFPPAPYANSEWFARLQVLETLDLVAEHLPVLLRKSGAPRSCEYFWGTGLNTTLSSTKLVLDFKANAKEYLPWSEFGTKYPIIDYIESLDAADTDQVMLKVTEVTITGYAAECIYELTGNTIGTNIGGVCVQLKTPLRETVINKVKELVNIVAKQVLGDADLPKLELLPAPTEPSSAARPVTTISNAVAALVWRANPNHSLRDTVNNVSSMVDYMPFVSIACALETRAPCNTDDVSNYHDMFNTMGLPVWLLTAYHQLELVLLQSPKVTTNLIIDTGGKCVTVRSNPTIPSNF